MGFVAALLITFIIMFIYAIMLVKSGNINFMDIQAQLNGFLLNPIFLVFITLVMYVIFFIVFYACGRIIHNRKFISFINIDSKINWMRILKGALLWFAVLMVFLLISLWLSPGSLKFTFDPGTFGIFLIVILLGIPVQASFEEIFFRGYLMQGFGLLSKKPIIPLLVTSILFAVLHGANGISSMINVFIVLQIFVIGLMLGIIALGENGIETAMGVHISNNLYAFLIVSSSDEVVSGIPSIYTTAHSTSADLYIGLLTTIIAAVVVLSVIFWGKKDRLMNVFRLKGV